MARRLLLLPAFAIALPQFLSARLTEHSSQQQVFEKADIVVIANVTSTRSTDERSVLSNIQPATEVFGVETEFEVCVVLKGRKDISTFKLHHYETHQQFTNGPLLIEIPKGKHSTYLLFLIEEEDGRYAPATGQTDPADSSVFRLLAASTRGFAAPEPSGGCDHSGAHPIKQGLSSGWTYQEMVDKADLVAIAQWVSATDVEGRSTLQDVNPPVKVVGVVTDFETDVVLKGARNSKDLKLQHFRFRNEDDARRDNAPGLIRIPPPVHGDDGREYPGGGRFLLLLKKESGNRFAPVTGQTDPSLYSVLQLLPAFSD